MLFRRAVIVAAGVLVVVRQKVERPEAHLRPFVDFLSREGREPNAFTLDALAKHQLVILGEVHHRPDYWARYDVDRDKYMADNIVSDLRGSAAGQRHALFIVGHAHVKLNFKYGDGNTHTSDAGSLPVRQLGEDSVYAFFPQEPVMTNVGAVHGRLASVRSRVRAGRPQKKSGRQGVLAVRAPHLAGCRRPEDLKGWERDGEYRCWPQRVLCAIEQDTFAISQDPRGLPSLE
jgi:hypothetical protein